MHLYCFSLFLESKTLCAGTAWYHLSRLLGSDVAPGPTRALAWLMRMNVGGRPWSGQEGDRERSLSLPLCPFISLSLSPRVCAYCRLQQFHNPRLASQPAVQAVLLRSTHTWTAAVQQQERASSAFHLQVLSPTSLGVDLVIIINNCCLSRDKPSAFQNSWFCLWDGVARTDKLGAYLKVFYFGQWSVQHRESADGCG